MTCYKNDTCLDWLTAQPSDGLRASALLRPSSRPIFGNFLC